MTGSHASNGAPLRARSGAFGAVLATGAGTLVALLALPVCLLFDLSVTGWAIGFGCVVFNRTVQTIVERSVRNSSLTVALGALGFSMIFRALITALTLFFVGTEVGAAGDEPIGLDRPDLARIALVVFLIGFTLDTGIEAIRRAAQREDEIAKDAASTSQETHA
ncbi:MAG: hypothetical protein JWM90_777 [Thermoleophilia bacterium]|nr:hypothetical protein [Thermoleophilia bacterium]